MYGNLELFIGGKWLGGDGRKGEDVLNPATEKPLARLPHASKDDLDLFTANPEKYAAQYDGHCAMGVSYESGHKDTVDPEAFTIVNGKLYVNHTKYWTTEWRKNESENISRADKNWVTVRHTPEPTK